MRPADATTLTYYAFENDLTSTSGWKCAKSKTRRNPKKFIRMAKIFRSQVKDIQPIFKFGVGVARNYKDAVRLDEKNGNSLFQDANTKEKDQSFDYDTFNVLARGKKESKGYTRIYVFVFDVKHDLRRKTRFAAGGHMTTAPKEKM